MSIISLHVNGERIPFDMPNPGTGPSVFVFSPPKSGSVFLNFLIEDLCKYGPQPNVNIPSALFDAGLNFQSAKLERATEIFSAPGYCFSGFRDWPDFLGGAFPIDNHKRLFLMRDPRDMLVSHYYSMARSHPIPPKGPMSEAMRRIREQANRVGIDEYVVGEAAQGYREMLDRLSKVWQHPVRKLGPNDRRTDRHETHRQMVLSVRYEDVVYAKADLALRICQFFEWPIDPVLVRRLAAKQDIFPDKERPDSHIRQVKPGNFRDKLRPETIAELNEIFGPHLRLFGYDTRL